MMLKIAVVCFLLTGFLMTPLAMGAKLLDDTVLLYLPFDEGKGEEVKDLSKSDKTGVLGTKGKNLPEWVEGKFGTALEFDGETNFVQIEETPDEAEQIRMFREIIDLNRKHLWVIGTVGGLPSFVLVKDSFRNVPEVAMTGWSFRSPGNTAMECYAIEE